MCEADVYLMNKDGVEELLLESVDRIVPSKDGIFLESIFSEQKTVKAVIKEMRLVSHKIVLEAVE